MIKESKRNRVSREALRLKKKKKKKQLKSKSSLSTHTCSVTF